MYELNKEIGNVFTSKSVGTGPSSYEKRMYRAAVSQRLRNTWIEVSSVDTIKKYLSPCKSWRRIAGAAVWLHSFLPSRTDGGKRSTSRCVRFTPGKGPPVPGVQETVWDPQPIWTSMRREKYLAPTGIRILGSLRWLQCVLSKRREPFTLRHTATSKNTGTLW